MAADDGVADEGVPGAETLPGVSLDNVTAGDSFSSPMTVTGVAPNDWYFEAIFPVELVDASGEVLAEAPAEAQSDWMQEGPIAFRADLAFEVDEPVEAELVLQEDMPGDGEEPRELRVPVLLTPAAE